MEFEVENKKDDPDRMKSLAPENLNNDLQRLYLESYPGKHDFARKFANIVEKFSHQVGIHKLRSYLIASANATAALDNALSMEPISQNDKGDKIKIETVVETLKILLDKVKLIIAHSSYPDLDDRVRTMKEIITQK